MSPSPYLIDILFPEEPAMKTNLTDLAAAYDDASLAYDRNPTEANRAAKIAAAWALESAEVAS